MIPRIIGVLGIAWLICSPCLAETKVETKVETVAKSLALQVTDFSYNDHDDLVIRYRIRYCKINDPQAKPQPDPIYYTTWSWLDDPLGSRLQIRNAKGKSLRVEESYPTVDHVLVGRKYHRILKPGGSVQGQVVIFKEDLQKAMKKLEVSPGEKLESRLSIELSGSIEPPVTSDMVDGKTAFFAQQPSGEWRRFELDPDAGKVLLDGIKRLNEKHDAAEKSTTEKDATKKNAAKPSPPTRFSAKPSSPWTELVWPKQ